MASVKGEGESELVSIDLLRRGRVQEVGSVPLAPLLSTFSSLLPVSSSSSARKEGNLTTSELEPEERAVVSESRMRPSPTLRSCH
jgi:hypothetical protein